MSVEIWLAFVLASVLILVMPGPTTTLLLATGLGRGRRAALAMVPGVVLGDLVAMVLSLAGVGTLLAASAELFTVVKWLGAAYLLILGGRMWRDAARQDEPRPATPGSARSLSAKAFVVTVLNPKATLFFIAFMPQFLRADAPLLPQLLILGATFLALSALNAAAYASLAGSLATVLSARFRRIVQRAGGAALIGAGLLTATLRRA